MLIRILAVFILLLSGCTALDKKSTFYFRESRYVMGTILDIQICTPGISRDVLDRSFLIAEELDKLLSNYNSESKLSYINSVADKQKVSIDLDMLKFLEQAIDLNKKTQGYFDVTVAPLVLLWSEAEKKQKLPDSQLISIVSRSVGSDKILLDSKNRLVSFSQSGVAIDSGGIGKGYAVDKIVEFLVEQNVKCALVNFGHSSIYAIGAPIGESSWRMIIAFPGEAPLGEIAIKDQALSASYSLGRSFEIDKKKYGSIINPITSVPMQSRIQSVVISSNATAAEALSKAILLSDDLASITNASDLKFDYLKKYEDEPIIVSTDFPVLDKVKSKANQVVF